MGFLSKYCSEFDLSLPSGLILDSPYWTKNLEMNEEIPLPFSAIIPYQNPFPIGEKEVSPLAPPGFVDSFMSITDGYSPVNGVEEGMTHIEPKTEKATSGTWGDVREINSRYLAR